MERELVSTREKVSEGGQIGKGTGRQDEQTASEARDAQESIERGRRRNQGRSPMGRASKGEGTRQARQVCSNEEVVLD